MEDVQLLVQFHQVLVETRTLGRHLVIGFFQLLLQFVVAVTVEGLDIGALAVRQVIIGGDWAKADEVVGMIDTYQQAKNKTLDISPKRMQAELKYNKMDVFRYCKIGYLVLGGLLLVLSFAMLFRRTRWMKVAVWLLGAGVLVVFHYHMFGMGMRWYIECLVLGLLVGVDHADHFIGFRPIAALQALLHFA